MPDYVSSSILARNAQFSYGKYSNSLIPIPLPNATHPPIKYTIQSVTRNPYAPSSLPVFSATHHAKHKDAFSHKTIWDGLDASNQVDRIMKLFDINTQRCIDHRKYSQWF